MNAGAKEKRFLDALESLFTGAEVDGDSGFVNLMRMKHRHFLSIRPILMERIDSRVPPETSFREELFDKLYTFFSRHFCESGSIYFRHLPAFAKIYERVYSGEADVELTWKTKALYYVKSDILVRSMPVKLMPQRGYGHALLFYFDASDIEHKKNNERREFIFRFAGTKQTEDEVALHLMVSYSQNGTKTNAGDIIRQARNAELTVHITERDLQNAIAVFQRQTEADFFINKDAGSFLREQFDLWLYQYMFSEESIFEQQRLEQLQAIKHTALDIINYIAQFEDELRRVWEKPKFARNVNYVVTLNKLSDQLLEKIATHKGANKQVKEWQTLNMVDKNFSMASLNRGQADLNMKNDSGPTNGACRFLPLDTKHFKNLEMEILGELGNLDEVLDGELVHSENWQALNTLSQRYRGTVRCIHIDPPYNTKTSGFLYRNEYHHSSWLTMMENRAQKALGLLAESGSFLCHVDENEYERLHLLFDMLQIPNAGTMIWDKRNPMTGGGGIAIQHEYVIWRSTSESPFMALEHEEHVMRSKVNEIIRKHGGVSSESRKEYANWVRSHPQLSGGKKGYCYFDDSGRIYSSVSLRAPEPRTDEKFHQPLLHPVTGRPCPVPPNGFSRTPELLRQMMENGEILFGKDHTTQPRQKFFLTRKQVTSVLQSALRGKADLDRLGLSNFPYCHSASFYVELLGAASTSSGTVLDYFAGSGTTAHAIINLNRKDDGKRKYVLVEMGDYFHTVLVPRIKKIIYTQDWKDGKPSSYNGSSHCFKYYSLEQYEETLRNARYTDSEQLELDSEKSPFEQYVFFGDDKFTHTVKLLKSGKLSVNLRSLYSDIDIAESLANVLGKQIRRRTDDAVTFADGTTERINLVKMTSVEQQHLISLLKPYLWWGE